MKYIRVIEDYEEYITTKGNLHDHILALQDSGFDFEGGIIKEADTIEELCDEFVIYGEHISPTHSHYLCLTDIDIQSCLEAKATIYGAIWTDKGLIYVAKMRGILPNGEIDWKLL